MKVQPTNMRTLIFMLFTFPLPGLGGSWVWNVTEKAKSLLVQREASTLNTLLFIYLIL